MFCLEPHKCWFHPDTLGGRTKEHTRTWGGLFGLGYPSFSWRGIKPWGGPLSSSFIHAALVMLLLLDKLLLWRASAAPGQGAFLCEHHIWRNKNSHGVTGGSVWVSRGEDKACHHAFPRPLVWNKHVCPWGFAVRGGIPLFAAALIQLPNTCRHAITDPVPRYHLLPQHPDYLSLLKHFFRTGLHQLFPINRFVS